MTKRDWTPYQDSLSTDDATALYHRMMKEPWRKTEEQDGIHYGLSYSMFGDVREHEISVIPDFLMARAEKVSAVTEHPINYVQAHRFLPGHIVRPHQDPKGMCVPMVVIGQQRTFRVGGTLDTPRSVKQSKREVSWHKPAEEILLEHGSLLVFNGGRVIHSMYPAEKDWLFSPLGFDYRISLLFRFTTPTMRATGAYGAGKSVRHAMEYERAVQDFQNEQAVMDLKT